MQININFFLIKHVPKKFQNVLTHKELCLAKLNLICVQYKTSSLFLNI